MLDEYAEKINHLLVEIFDQVLAVEEQMLKNVKLDLSITEVHTLEAVACSGEQGGTISSLAQALGVTKPTVTVAIKRLEKKQYVEKLRSETDGRIVHIALTRMGRKVAAAHRYFHKQMVRAFTKEVSEEQKPVLLGALENLHAFLGRSIEND